MGAHTSAAHQVQKQNTGCGCLDNCPYNAGGDNAKIVCMFKSPTTQRIKKKCPDHPEYKHTHAAQAA